MPEQAPYAYDAFISHSHADRDWVHTELLPRLESAGLKVIIDARDFEPGAPLVTEKERAVQQSRKTVLVLSPAYLASEWAEFDSILVQSLDPAARKRRLIPVVRERCKFDLRISTLVSVDLTADDDMQWQRLLRTLDPDRPETMNPIQRFSLRVIESSSSVESPGWHPAGIAWLVVGMLGLMLLVGLANLLLYDWPALRNTASVMVGALTFLLGFLGLREDRDFIQRLSHIVGQNRPARVGMGVLLAAGLLLWVGAGWPKVQENIFGPLGPRPPGVRRFAIGEWKNLTEGASPYEGVWTEGTRRVLYQKLSRLDKLQGICADCPQVTDTVRHDLDLWIDGTFSKIASVKLSADMAGRGGELERTVSVQRDVNETSEEVETEILATQDELAKEIVAALQIDLPAEVSEAMADTPTSNPQALQLNNGAVILFEQGGDVEQAESLLQEAIDLDPNYADAHNNLGRLLYLQQNWNGAIAKHKRATDLLPGYPVFHFNLGLAYDRAGDFDAAIRAYRRALELDPAYVKALNNLAFVYLQIGELDKAAELLHRGLSLDPGAAYLHKNLGRVRLEQGRVEGAIDELIQAIQLSDAPYAEALFYLAQAYRDVARIDDACATLSEYALVAEDDAWDDPSRPAEAGSLAAELQCP